MGSCSGIKDDGGRCRGQAIRGSEWCFSHHPDYEEQRRRRASKGGKRGGRGRGGSEIAEIKTLLSDLTDRVLGDEEAEPLETGRAAVANQLINTRLRAVEVERKIKETEELEARLEALERAAEGHRGGRRWGQA